MIKLGRRLFASVRNLTPGDLIEFGYNGKVRTGVVVSPDWKGNVDCYVFDNPEDMPEELAEHILMTTTLLDSGDLYVDFGNSYEFKSFKQNGMSGIQQIEYKIFSSELTAYNNTRMYTDSELKEELGEYFENEYTLNKFPNLARDNEELTQMLLSAPVRVLSRGELLSLENSDVGGVLSSSDPYQSAIRVGETYGRDVNSIENALKNNIDLPMPIVIDGGGLYLMAGNTRLSLMAGLGYTMPVKVITYSPYLLEEEETITEKVIDTVTEVTDNPNLYGE